MNNKKPFAVSKNFGKKLALGLSSITIVFVNVCPPALIIGGAL